MPSAETTHAVPRERKNDPGRFDPITTHQNGTIVQWCVGSKQIQHQLATQHCADSNTGIEKILGPEVAP